MITESNDAIAENLYEAERKLAALKESGPKLTKAKNFRELNPDTGLYETQYEDITDPEIIQRNVQDYNDKLEKAAAEFTGIQAIRDQRIAEGLGTAEDFVYVNPDARPFWGMYERLKDRFGIEGSSDRRERRKAELEAIAAAGGGSQVNVVVGGDTVNAVGGSTAVKQGDRTSIVSGRSGRNARAANYDYGGMAQ